MLLSSSSTLLTYSQGKVVSTCETASVHKRVCRRFSGFTYEYSIDSAPDNSGDGASENDVVRVHTLDDSGIRGLFSHLLRSFLFSLIMIDK